MISKYYSAQEIYISPICQQRRFDLTSFVCLFWLHFSCLPVLTSLQLFACFDFTSQNRQTNEVKSKQANNWSQVKTVKRMKSSQDRQTTEVKSKQANEWSQVKTDKCKKSIKDKQTTKVKLIQAKCPHC
jgi:hypothetical protein